MAYWSYRACSSCVSFIERPDILYNSDRIFGVCEWFTSKRYRYVVTVKNSFGTIFHYEIWLLAILAFVSVTCWSPWNEAREVDSPFEIFVLWLLHSIKESSSSFRVGEWVLGFISLHRHSWCNWDVPIVVQNLQQFRRFSFTSKWVRIVWAQSLKMNALWKYSTSFVYYRCWYGPWVVT